MKKTKTLLLTVLLISLNSVLFACLPGGITFTTQADIDNFSTNYPGCSEIEGDVCIGFCDGSANSHILNLNGLSQITSIGGSLYIRFNFDLTNLNGLEGLVSVAEDLLITNNFNLENLDGLNNLTSDLGGELRISFNQNLSSMSGLSGIGSVGGDLSISDINTATSLSGLQNITSVGGDLFISYNNNLNNLNGLSSLESVGGFLHLETNMNLQNVDGLENLTSIDGYIFIFNNDEITSLNGLKNIDPSTIHSSVSWREDLEIKSNDNLSVCNVKSICIFLSDNLGTNDIANNDFGCNSEFQVEDLCDDLPDCTSLTQPSNGAYDVLITTDLIWEEAYFAEGYFISIGTTSEGTDIVDNEDVGSQTYYDPEDLPCGTQIFVTISPYNWNGTNTNCTEESFFTESVTADAGEDVSVCNGSSVVLEASGGNQYSWTPEDDLDDPTIYNPTASPTETTVYTVTVSIDGRCYDSSEVEVSVIEGPTPNASATNETGNNQNDGTATANPTGGIPPYSYEWSTGEYDQTIENLSPGSYHVTVSDYNECFGVETVEVLEFSCQLLTAIVEQSDTICFGNCNGFVSVVDVANGLEPFNYIWSNGSTDSSIVNLCSGSYSVTINDANNCTLIDSFIIFSNSEISVNPIGTNESVYGANDGIATCSPSGGAPPYSYNWSNGQSTQSIDSLSPGDYIVTVIDNTGCSASDSVTILPFNCPTLSLMVVMDDTVCFGECDGFITIDSVINGIYPYTYNWSTGDSTSTITALCSGIYSVTVTDSFNCSKAGSYNINSNSEIFVNPSSTDETSGNSNDGTATANPSGGLMPYTYAWSNGEFTQTITGLSPGYYYVTVADALACAVVDSVEVNAASAALVINFEQGDVSCYGENDGYIDIVSIDNGTEPYTYTWSTGSTQSKIYNLRAGDYSLELTDAKKKTASKSFTITQPDDIHIYNIEKVDISNDVPGKITVSIDNEDEFSFLWTGPNNYTSTSKNIDNLTEKGCYKLVVTNNTTSCQKDTTVCIDKSTANIEIETSKIKIYPIPSKDNFKLDFSSLKDTYAEIKIIDITGKEILNTFKLSKHKIITIDTESINSGVYLVRISFNEKTVIKKLVISK